MRHNSPDSIGKAVGAVVETSPGPGEDDFLARVNATITNFKELAKIFAQLRPHSELSEEPAPDTSSKVERDSQTRTPGLLDYLQLAIRSGYGDTPIGELIERASPHTLKKIMEIFENAGKAGLKK